MTALPFYNENSGRRYPFQDIGPLEMEHSAGGLRVFPDSAIVDCTVIAGVELPFRSDLDVVYLSEVSRHDDVFTFTFRTTAVGFEHVTLSFCRRLHDPEFTVGEAEATTPAESVSISTSTSELPLAVDDCPDLLLEGWLVTGDLHDLSQVLASGEFLYRLDSDLALEPARVQSLFNSYIKSISLANENRTLAGSAPGCPSPADSRPSYVTHRTCLTGKLLFREGFNVQLTQDVRANAIVIQGAVGSGLGQPCDEITLRDGEQPPDGSLLLSGGPSCNEIIKTINGLSGPRIAIQGGVGVRVSVSEDDPHTLQLVVDFNGLAVCQ